MPFLFLPLQFPQNPMRFPRFGKMPLRFKSADFLPSFLSNSNSQNPALKMSSLSTSQIAIKPGTGLWNVTLYPFGGCFYRVNDKPLPVSNIRTCAKPGWVFVSADSPLPGSTYATKGEQTLCVQSIYLCSLAPALSL